MPEINDEVWIWAKVVKVRSGRFEAEIVLDLEGFKFEIPPEAQLIPTSNRGGPAPAKPESRFGHQVSVSPTFVEPADDLNRNNRVTVWGRVVEVDQAYVVVEIDGTRDQVWKVRGKISDLAPAPD